MILNHLLLQISNGLLAVPAIGLFGGLFLLLIGAAIFYTVASWRFRGPQVAGEIIGVRGALALSRIKALLATIQALGVSEPRCAFLIETAESSGASPIFMSQLRSSRSKSRRIGVISVVRGLDTNARDFWQSRGLLELRHGVRTSRVVMELNRRPHGPTAPRPTGNNGETILFQLVRHIGQDGSAMRILDRTVHVRHP